MNNHFPQNLSILRRRAGYTQESFAEALGVSRQAVGKWESGQALPEWTAVAALFVFLIAGVYLFITAGMAEDDFKEEYPEVQPLYDPEEKREFQLRFRLGVALPVMGILADAALCGILATMPGGEAREMYIGALFLGVLTLCVTPLVYLGCLSDRYELREMSRRERRKTSDLCGPIMILATAGFLLWGLMWDGWKVSWVCFLVGAALCALVEGLAKKD